ncbi:hypothetical protein RZS08_00670, partial [Arthrospira platensis SPKY1]|nr:hypothetical protein [Arthrospira platensis SPKY1]
RDQRVPDLRARGIGPDHRGLADEPRARLLQCARVAGVHRQAQGQHRDGEHLLEVRQHHDPPAVPLVPQRRPGRRRFRHEVLPVGEQGEPEQVGDGVLVQRVRGQDRAGRVQ